MNRSSATPTRRRIFHWLLRKFGVAARRLHQFRQYLKRNLLYQRPSILEQLSRSYDLPAAQRVVIALTHIVSSEEASDANLGAPKLDRLKRTIDGLLCSFAGHRIELNVCTLSGRNLLSELPAYQRQHLNIRTFDDCEPMHVEFRAHDVLVERADDAEWFLFIEDDIIINDGYFLQKVAAFNAAINDPSVYLNPHRYEFVEGRKCYIDLTVCTRIDWDKTSEFVFNGNTFAECSNPHAAMFLLNQEQIRRWIRLGRNWHDEAVTVGPLETAATYGLMEHFRIYKPAPPNLSYLEVQHFDNKYSWPPSALAEVAKPYAMSAKPLSD